MRPILRSPALILLAILTIPADFILFTLASHSQPRDNFAVFQSTSIACLLIGFGVAFVGVRVGSAAVKRKPFDELMVEIHLGLVLVGIYFVIVSFALLFAIASPSAALFICAAAAAWVVLWSLPQPRKSSLSSSYVVKRSPDVVFSFLSDSRNDPKYRADIESVELVTGEPIGLGARFRYRARVRNTIVLGIEEIVDYEPNRRLTTRSASARHPNLAELTFEPVQGGTRVTNRFEFQRSIASALMGGWFRQPATNRIILARRRAGEARIKEILENGQT
jgi:polyketide cyclase/dehydrase/lipid transport protein